MTKASASTATSRSLRRLQVAGYLALATMVIGFASWTWFANINGAVIAHATLEAESFSKKVQHREGGNVLKISVKDGDVVQTGQELVVLDPTEINAQLGIIDGQLDENLVKRARLEAQRDLHPTLELPQGLSAKPDDPHLAEVLAGQQKLLQSNFGVLKSKQDQFTEQIGQLNEQISGVEAQLVGNKRQQDLMGQETDSLRKLQVKGLVPATRLMEMDRDAAKLAGETGQLSASKAQTLAKISEVKLQILQAEEDLRTQALNELRETESKLVELQGQRLATRSKLDHTTIKAPITGTVYQLSVHTEGGVIAPGETLMMILPQDDDLVLQAAVSPNDINSVREGQKAEVRFSGLNSRTTPAIFAQVTQVAANTTKPDSSKSDALPFYATTLVIPAGERAKLGDNKLRPGMAAEAFIATEARSPFSYLIRPLIESWSHAMREK
ncbi:MAG: HlyD family type I secretion periplasmic adaptor subunit [Pseudomonadota bacterium]|nr:HlyD family type I secretion periplasmic adaptor subunit [Pseudomonadota bacterium]